METQEFDLKRIPMKGTIKEENFRQRNVPKAAVISLAVGSIVLGTFAYHNHLETDKKLAFSSNYKSYSAQIEELFDVDISSDMEENLNKFENISLLVNEYKKEEDESKKNTLREQVLKEKSNVENLSLGILKGEIAKEHGGNWDDYHVNPEKADGTWRAYGNDDSFVLNDDLSSLADAIGNFQSLGNSEEIKNVDDKKIISRYEGIIKETANLIKNTSKKAK